MPHHDQTISVTGAVQRVFAHRFTLEEDGGKTHLADLGPKGLEAFPLREGLRVSLEGEQRPSEIKVSRITADGGEPVSIHHKKPHHLPGGGQGDAAGGPPIDAAAVLAAVARAGWQGASADRLRRKPKHVEVLARQAGGAWQELHVDADGRIYKEASPKADKWGPLPA